MSFQRNAFQNPVEYDHLGFQVTDTIDAKPRAIAIDQSIQFTTDQWAVELNSSEAWRARSRATNVNLSTGLINENDENDLVRHITEGRIDEWELVWTPASVTGRIRGRDAAALACDTALQISYVTGGVTPPVTDPADLPPGLQPIPGVTERLYLAGNWRASTVAIDLCDRVGLQCSWQAPDYVLREDVEVSGPIIGALYQLIEPFCHFEPYKVDIWCEGNVLIVRQRQGLVEEPGPLGPTPGTLNTITAAQMRIQQLLVRARYLDQIRILRLSGAVLGPCSELALIDAFTEQVDTENSVESLRITTSGTRRRVDNAMLTQQVETYDLTTFEFRSRETTVWTQDDLEFDANCRILNNPLERGSQTRIETMDRDDGVIRETGRVTMTKAYDSLDFIVAQTTTTETQTTDDLGNKVLQPTQREVKRFFDNGTKMYTEETTIFKADSDGNLTFDSKNSGPGGGYRPGGPGRSPRETQGTFPPAYINEVIDNEPGAKDFMMQNKSLTQADLDILRDQVEASSGATEYQVEMQTLNTPWIRKGQMLEITDLFYENGTSPVDLPVFLITEVQIDYVEDDQNPHALSTIKGVFWSKTYGQDS